MAKKSHTFQGKAKPYGKSGHFHEPMRHSLQARGIKTGKWSLKSQKGTRRYDKLNRSHGNLYGEITLIQMPSGNRDDEYGIIGSAYTTKKIGLADDEVLEKELFHKTETRYTKSGAEKKVEDYRKAIDKFFKDTDGDGVPNATDCDPLDPTKQDEWKQLPNSRVRWKEQIIEGYPVKIVDFSDRTGKNMVLTVPSGETKEDKLMFDEFVYYNQLLYHQETEKKLIDNFKKFVSDWKKKHKVK